MKRTRWGMVGITLLVGLVPALPRAEAQSAPAWEVVELEPLPTGNATQVLDINNAGVSVGASRIDTELKPVRWSTTGSPTALPLPEGCQTGTATAISDTDVIVGIAACSVGSDDETADFGLVWPPGAATVQRLDRGTLPRAVNDVGVAVGEFMQFDQVSGDVVDRSPFVQGYGGQRYPLQDGGSTFAGAIGITGAAYVVGTVTDLPGAPAGFPRSLAVGWYGPYVFPLLGTGQDTAARDVNERGDALIRASGGGGPTQWFIVGRDGVLPLNVVGAADEVSALNDIGIAVGEQRLQGNGSGTSPEDLSAAVLYAFGQTIRIETLVSDAAQEDFLFRSARSVNDDLWIVGNDNPAGGSWLVRPPSAV